MSRRKRKGPDGPSNAYLLSFGDTMTTLLAFFIVLNSLAEEQTGANLYSGTGSFVRSLQTFGMPGRLTDSRTRNPVKHKEVSPLYVAEPPDDAPPMGEPNGPDAEDDDQRVIDREAEEFERFLTEMERLFTIRQQPTVTGDTAFDFFEPIRGEPPYLSEKYGKVLGQILPLLHQQNYHVDVTVWATTPSPGARERAVRVSQNVVDEIARRGRLSDTQRQRLNAIGRPWFDSKAKRPVLTFAVRKISSG